MSRFFRLRTRGFLEQPRQNYWPETLCQVSPHQVPNAVGCAARAFRRLDHLVIVGYMDQPCHLGAFRHFTKVLLWRLPHPIHLSCISNPLTLGELRTASEHRFPHFHPCHRRIASVCPADGQAVPGHSEHAARRAVALGGSTTLAVRPAFLNGRLDHRSRQAALPAVTGRGLDMEAVAKSAASSPRIIPIRGLHLLVRPRRVFGQRAAVVPFWLSGCVGDSYPPGI